jgi:hypothetical protein
MSQTRNNFTGEYTESTKKIMSVFDGKLARSMVQQEQLRRARKIKSRRVGCRLILTDTKPRGKLRSDHSRDHQQLGRAFDLANKRGHSICGALNSDTASNAQCRMILRESTLLSYLSRRSALRTRRQAREMFEHRVDFLRGLPRADAFAVIAEKLLFKVSGERRPWEIDPSSNGREEQWSDGDFADDVSMTLIQLMVRMRK